MLAHSYACEDVIEQRIPMYLGEQICLVFG